MVDPSRGLLLGCGQGSVLDLFGGPTIVDPLEWALDHVQLLAPIPRPGKILAIGLNYRDHIDEQRGKVPEAPVVFAKVSTAVVGPDDAIRIPYDGCLVDYEGELAVVIGRRCHRVQPPEALGCIAGYTILNDVSARDLQRSERQWIRAKGCDTFCPMGPWLVTLAEIETPPRRAIETRVNGEVRQSSNTSMMIRDPLELVSYLSQTMTLEPGDIIATGTPSGVGAFREPPTFLKDGDVVEITIEGIGTLRNPVRGT